MALAPERIVEVALDLLNEVGLDGLTTRRLAEALDVKGPSLYHHFQNKSELLGQMAVAMLTRALADLDTSVSWDEWLRSIANATRRVILQHRDGARILGSSSPNEVMRTGIIPSVERPLIAAGFPEEVAAEVVSLMASFVIGYTLNEQNKVIRDYMQTVLDLERNFAFAVDTIVLGVGERVATGNWDAVKPTKARPPARRAKRKTA
jgi:TetR/AcrR family tetracycline transcriptional repressor